MSLGTLVLLWLACPGTGLVTLAVAGAAYRRLRRKRVQ